MVALRKNFSKRKPTYNCFENDSNCLFTEDSGGGVSEVIENGILNISTTATTTSTSQPQSTYDFLTFYKRSELNFSAINQNINNNAPSIYNLLNLNYNGSSSSDTHFGSGNNMAVIDNSDLFSGDYQPVSFADEDVDISPFSEFGDFYRHSTGMTVVYCVLYVIIFIVGLIGNFFVIAVVLRAPRMRTVTNFFIANLAIADILVIVFCLPATLMGNIFVRKYCLFSHQARLKVWVATFSFSLVIYSIYPLVIWWQKNSPKFLDSFIIM